jgi:hypothetical protein
MGLTSDDKHSMQLDPKHVPNPAVSDRRSGVFNLSLGVRIVCVYNFLNCSFVILPVVSFSSFHRLLENERLLLVLADRDKHAIYLESLAGMDAAIQRAKAIKTLNRDKMGEHVLFAYDEAKRTLAVCAAAKVSPVALIRVGVLMFYVPTKMQLYAFVFDETFRTLQGQGSAANLAPWYGQADISILQLCSVCGGDEVVLMDSNAQVRIFSFVTQQIR